MHKLQEGQHITADGQLDEPAWTEIPWSTPFVDIEGDLGLAPQFETKGREGGGKRGRRLEERNKGRRAMRIRREI